MLSGNSTFLIFFLSSFYYYYYNNTTQNCKNVLLQKIPYYTFVVVRCTLRKTVVKRVCMYVLKKERRLILRLQIEYYNARKLQLILLHEYNFIMVLGKCYCGELHHGYIFSCVLYSNSNSTDKITDTCSTRFHFRRKCWRAFAYTRHYSDKKSSKHNNITSCHSHTRSTTFPDSLMIILMLLQEV